MKAFQKRDIIEKIWHRELAPFVCDDGCDCFRLIVWSSHELVLSLGWHFHWVVWEEERERLRFSVSQVMQYKSLFRPRLKLFIYTKAHCVYVWSCRLCLPATGHLILYYWMRITAKKEPLTYTHMWPVHRGPPHTDWWTKCVDRHWDHSGELI